MFRSILASITMYSIVLLSIGQTAFALPQANSADNNPAKDKNCATCSAGASTNSLDRLATLGRRTQNIELLPISRSQAKGFPIELVSSSSGELAFAQTDLAFKDNPLMVFQRTYLSSRNADNGLGRGWSFAFNDSIALSDNSAVLTNSAGDDYTYRRTDAKHYVLQTSDTTDVKEFNVNGNTITATNGDVTKVYKRTSGDYYLSQIIAPAGFEVTINRNSNNKIRSISSINGEIKFDWSSGNNAKLLAVSDNTGRRTSFTQSNGSLQNATTVTGSKWQYEYTSGKLSSVIDPANRIALRAKYNASGRTAEIGDAVGINRFAYEINANKVSSRTTFTNSLGYARVFQHNERGVLTIVSDADGTLLSVQYNEANQPVQATDASGTATFEYDAQHRLTRQLLPNGDEKIFEYAANGKLKTTIENGVRTEIVRDEANLNENRIRGNGKNVKSTYNRRGRETRLQVENGLTVDFEYDEKGHQTADVYSDKGRYEKTFDAAGRITSKKTPSGFVHGYEYDDNNRLVRQSDNRGRSGRVERDASGNLTKIINSNADWLQISRDEAGRIVQLTNSRGQSRRYIYNSLGALTRFVGADGRDLQFQYNERGEIQSVIKTQTDELVYQRNQRSNLAKIQQQSASKNSFWQMQKINYVKPLANATVQDYCAFGDAFYMGGDGWMDSWGADSMFAMDQSLYGGGCYDPFADMFGGGGGFGGDFGGGFGGETCYQCRQRETNSCNNIYNSTLQNNTGGLLVGTGGCIVVGVYTAVVGGLICQVFVSGGAAIQNDAARQVRDNCLTDVASKCASICNR